LLRTEPNYAIHGKHKYGVGIRNLAYTQSGTNARQAGAENERQL
jgi:hypothetical protein